MIVVHVHVHVKPGDVEAFKAATTENASQSVKEAGVAHKATAHYLTWRDAVAGMMAVPRTSDTFAPVFYTP